MHPLLPQAFEFFRLLHGVPSDRTHAPISLEKHEDGYRIIWFGKRSLEHEREFVKLVGAAGFHVINLLVWSRHFARWQQKKKTVEAVASLDIRETSRVPKQVDWRRMSLASGMRVDFERFPHLLDVFDGVDLRGLNANTIAVWTLPTNGRKLVADLRGLSPLRACLLDRLDLERSIFDGLQTHEIVDWIFAHPKSLATYGAILRQSRTDIGALARLARFLCDDGAMEASVRQMFFQTLLSAPAMPESCRCELIAHASPS
jgi:hypothetical protein